MGSHVNAQNIVYAICLIALGVGFGVMAVALEDGGLNENVVYLTGLTLALTAAIVIAILPLYRQVSDVVAALSEHKEHDRAAIREAVQYSADDDGHDTGPRPALHRVRH